MVGDIRGGGQVGMQRYGEPSGCHSGLWDTSASPQLRAVRWLSPMGWPSCEVSRVRCQQARLPWGPMIVAGADDWRTPNRESIVVVGAVVAQSAGSTRCCTGPRTDDVRMAAWRTHLCAP